MRCEPQARVARLGGRDVDVVGLPSLKGFTEWLPEVDREEYWFLDGPRPEDGRLSDGPNKKSRLREEARQRRGPTLREKAVSLANVKGTIRTRDLEAIGVPRHYPALMCAEGLLERIGFGLYRAVDNEVEAELD